MKNSPDMMGGTAGVTDRFAGQSGYRGTARRDDIVVPEQSPDGGRVAPPTVVPPMADMATMPTMLEPPPVPASPMSLNDVALAEPVFPPVGWMDETGTASLADHPLLRGLLLELPPKGSTLPPGWLDRWFDAARSILELLYVHPTGPTPRR